VTSPPFIHLRVHSEYSLIDGLVRVKPLVARCEALGMPAVGLTDHNNLFALLKFYNAARSAGLKPLIGCDLALRDAQGELSLVTVFVENREGYGNLTRLISDAYLAPERASAVAVSAEALQAQSRGLLLLLGRHSPLGRSYEEGSEAFDLALAPWQGAFGDRVFFEITRTGRAGEEPWLAAAVMASARTGVPLVATNDVRFLAPEDYEAHETRVCIHEGRVLGDPRRPRRYSEAQYFCTAEEMQARFEDLPEALANTVVLAQRCNLTLALDTYYLPEYPIPKGDTLEGYFRRASWEGLEARLARMEGLASDGPSGRTAYEARLQEELDIICQMDFPGYFLIVAEFIAWAKANGVPVGPGRGSGAGSLVAYALGITNLDPLAYDLLFERFLNPERVSMPDFDVDFCMEGRDRVIGHVADLYGAGAVSQIVTYGTMAAKAVVRDVARVQGKPYGLADKLSKMIPFEVGMTLGKALEQEPTLKAFVEENEEVAEIM
jgi:DNA polymerase-3 subunit alpha